MPGSRTRRSPLESTVESLPCPILRAPNEVNSPAPAVGCRRRRRHRPEPVRLRTVDDVLTLL